MTSIFPPFNRRTSFRKQPYFFEAGRGVNSKGLAGPIPALSLTFTSGALDPRITFSRPSLATYFDSTGKLTYAPNNLVLRSQEFDNAAWSKSAVTVSADSVVAPDGTTTADTITENSTTDLHVVFASVLSVPTNTAVIFSVYLRANTRNFAMLRIGGGGFITGPAIKANLTGSGSTATIEGPVTSSSITPVGGGWYRVSMIFTTITSAPVPNIGPHDNGSSITYAGNGTGSVYAWGAQFEVVTYQTTPSTYVATTASAYYGPRFEYDPVTLVPRGLLIEEAMAANLALYSQQFDNAAWVKTASTVTADAIASPDGLTNADKLIGTAVTSEHYIEQSISFTTGTAYTFSFYAKAGEISVVSVRSASAWAADPRIRFTLTGSGTVTVDNGSPTGTITPVGNGWYRCTMTATTNATVTGVFRLSLYSGAYSYLGDGTSGAFIYGAQLEARSFATSYLPTGASTAARSADDVSMTGTNFSSWYSSGQGTFITQGDVSFVGSGDKYVVAIDGANGRIHYVSTATLTAFDGTNVVSTGQTTPANATFRTATAWSGSTMSVCANGATAVGGSYDGSWGTTALYIGQRPPSNNMLNGHIASIQFYTSRLSNDQLQALTQPSLEASMFLTFDTSSDSFVDASWGP